MNRASGAHELRCACRRHDRFPAVHGTGHGEARRRPLSSPSRISRAFVPPCSAACEASTADFASRAHRAALGPDVRV